MTERKHKKLIEDLVPLPEYSLGARDFSDENKPKDMQWWEYPNPVNRDNFVAFTVNVFGASQGCPEAHAMQYMRLKAITGFDAFATNRVFKEAGGWDSLTSEEQFFVTECFMSVMAHKQVGYVHTTPETQLLNNLPAENIQRLTLEDYQRMTTESYKRKLRDTIRYFKLYGKYSNY